jgi:hypothetical protein
MTGLLLRALLFLVIAGAIYWGVRRIWRDWRNNFRDLDKRVRQRDLAERARPDVITLERGKDGKFRPPDER